MNRSTKTLSADVNMDDHTLGLVRESAWLVKAGPIPRRTSLPGIAICHGKRNHLQCKPSATSELGGEQAKATSFGHVMI